MPSSTFAPFRSRVWAVLWSASLVSNIGTWMETVVLGSLVARDTKSASAVALVAAAGFLPTALCAPIGGVISDRVDRRRFLLVTVAGETFFSALLAVLVGVGQRDPKLLSVVVFLESCVSALAMPNRQAMMPELVDPDQVPAALALGSAAWNGGRIVGATLAIPLVGLIGAGWTLGINAISFVCMLIAVAGVKIPARTVATSDASMSERLAEGMRAVRSIAAVNHAMLAIATMAVTAAPFIGLIPIVSESVLGGGRSTTGTLITAQGIGSVIGAVAYPRFSTRLGRSSTLIASITTVAVGLFVYGLAPSVPVAALALVTVGAGYFATLIGWQTVTQLSAPANLRARVVSVFSIALGLPYVIGLAIQGPLADHFGLRIVTRAQAVAFAAAMCALALVRPRWREDVDRAGSFGHMTASSQPSKPDVTIPADAAPSTLVCEDLIIGTGDEAVPGRSVEVHYVGVAWSTGAQFDASWDRREPFVFPLGAGHVIRGWDQGVQGMKVGGRRRLTIPPELGYGSRGAGGVIKPNETLVFVVDLLGLS